ncbi:MAG: hypothetical protein HWQ43_06215 [Nostoc sp. JL31]|uniref:hypothetical protein n=1 Tax=Nostoc sp. JL31 TaxID=2815395 RepID=UPI0025F8A639|nr:hypothetical protein [Nostoc sp. JL31]MBN3888770.1 hypothetical protein [Nostoc sp. JL31]
MQPPAMSMRRLTMPLRWLTMPLCRLTMPLRWLTMPLRRLTMPLRWLTMPIHSPALNNATLYAKLYQETA